VTHFASPAVSLNALVCTQSLPCPACPSSSRSVRSGAIQALEGTWGVSHYRGWRACVAMQIYCVAAPCVDESPITPHRPSQNHT